MSLERLKTIIKEAMEKDFITTTKNEKLSISASKIGRIEIAQAKWANALEIRYFRATDCGGFKRAQLVGGVARHDLRLIRDSCGISPHDHLPAIIQFMKSWLTQPPIEKTQSSSANQREIFIQNLIGRLFQEKTNKSCRISRLANNEEESCRIIVPNLFSVVVHNHKIMTQWTKADGRVETKFISFMKEDPSFDPEKLVSRILEFASLLEASDKTSSQNWNSVTFDVRS